MTPSIINSLIHIDRIAVIMVCLISFIGIIISSFSTRYMKGDSLYYRFFLNIIILLISVILITITDNLLLFFTAWCCSNKFLADLITHKSSWHPAKASGEIAIKNFILGSIFVGSGFFLLYKTTGSLSIEHIINNSTDSWHTSIALIFLLIGAMTQSALWPFHRWLISSPNSPTPVSALMHAGIVNGGGFLLIRFAPLFLNSPTMLNLIFIAGLISALLGSFWKLIQNDVKRMLACSTIGQMGFMFMQCGLGLFASALAHLCWHGIFKAHLFLTANSAAQEKKIDLDYPPSLTSFLLSLSCGALATYIFLLINNGGLLPTNTNLFIVGIVFILSSQVALTILDKDPFKNLPFAISFTILVTTIYATTTHLFDSIVSELNSIKPQEINALHFFGFIILFAAWLFILFINHSRNNFKRSTWWIFFYVKALNSSQPHPSTITTHRKEYDYV